MKPKQLKKFLLSEIKLVSENVNEYCFSKGKDFTRKRKLSFETVIKTLIGMESKSLSNELITAFDTEPEMPSTSAFIQQRYKIKPEAFKAVFDGFTSRLINNTSTELRIFTIDGSDIQIATNSDDATSYFPGTNGQNPYNLLHLNALYDLNNHIYTDAIIQGGMDKNEHIALQEMVDNSDILKALVIADRGYESFNSMAHIQEKSRLKELSSRKQCQSIRPSLEKIKVYAREFSYSLPVCARQLLKAPYTERYVRCCERTAVSHRLLLDFRICFSAFGILSVNILSACEKAD